MQWFTVAWWRWRLAQVRGRNPLVRTSDRIEVAVMALAVVVSLAVIPVGAAIGTAVHEEHARTYAAQQLDRHRVPAPAPTADDLSHWPIGDVENATTFPARYGAQADIWVDRTGRQVSPPAASWQAGVDAVVAAVGFWLAVSAAAALLVAAVRRWLRHARFAGWNRDIASLVHDDGGRTNRHR